MSMLRRFEANGATLGSLSTSSAGVGDTSFDHVGPGWAVENSGSSSRQPRIRFDKPAGASLVQWVGLGNLAQTSGRFYVEFSAWPSGTLPFLLTATASANRTFDVALLASGRLRLHDSSNAQVGLLPVMALNTIYRVEWLHNASDVTVSLYPGDSTLPIGSVVWSAGPSASVPPLDRINVGGNSGSVSLGTCFFDDILVTNDAEALGPKGAYLDGWGLPTWRSEFDSSGPIDSAEWSVKDASWFGNTLDRAVIRSSNAFVDDGDLVLRGTWRTSSTGSPPRWHDTGYVDHRIGGGGANASETIYAQQYGRWEICATTPTGNNTLGTLAAFWLRCNENLGEIDIMEAWGYGGVPPTTAGQLPGGSALTFHSSTMSSAVNGKPYRKTLIRYNEALGDYSNMAWAYISKNLPLHPAFDGFHTWAFEYMPDYIAAFYDGQQVCYLTPTMSDPHNAGSTYAWLWDPDFFGSPFHMRVNLHIGISETYWGVPDNANRALTSDPLDYRIKYVRAWEYLP